jgi:tetratricopeptide (TPR) repeat protein
MEKFIKSLEPPDIHHLLAAQGWLGLGNFLEADEELDKITPQLRDHAAVLSVRYDVYAKAKKWDAADEIAGRLVKLMPDQPSAWICLAYATRRKAGSGIPDAKQILTEAEIKFPGEYLIRYNLACYECQLGNLKEAMKWLEKAIDVGGKKDVRTMALDDPDLKPLWREIAKI